MIRHRLLTTVLVIVLAAAAAGGFLAIRVWPRHAAAFRPTPSSADSPTPSTSAPPTPQPPAVRMPTAAGVARVLAAPLASPRLGSRVLAEVVDGQSGALLYDRGAPTAAAPASTAKLATAVALLSVRHPSDRITTQVVTGPAPGTVVLVGGGDPTLTAAAPGQPGAYAGAARVSDLAAQLARRHVSRVVVDASLFSGPAVSPDWAPADVPSDYAAPITAAMVDGGRDSPHALVRSADPALAAGRELAAALHLPAWAVSFGRAPTGAPVLARVESPPLSELVAQMLEQSDDVIAECLARLVAVARGEPASFTGAAAAIRAVIRGLGVDIGAGLLDGSGLAAADRLTPATLTALLRLAATPAHPTLHDVLAGLPVAGWTGTLADRYRGSPGAGLIRAKTGTLSGVSTLAGLVHDRDGRVLVFALLAEAVGPSQADTRAAETALDTVASTLVGCGCR